MDIGVLILSCDKNNDLAPFVKKTVDKFIEQKIPTLIVSEFDVSNYSGYSSIKCKDTVFSNKLKQGLLALKTKYVLILLDDYYVHDDCIADKLKKWDMEINKTSLLALRICKNHHLWKKTKGNTPKVYKKINPYDVDFHPTVWNSEILLSIIRDKELTAWEIEPLFSDFFKDNPNKSGISSVLLVFDELIVQGKFFRKQFKKFCELTYVGKKKKLTRTQELLFKLKRFLYHITPRVFIRTAKKLIKKKTYSK